MSRPRIVIVKSPPTPHEWKTVIPLGLTPILLWTFLATYTSTPRWMATVLLSAFGVKPAANAPLTDPANIAYMEKLDTVEFYVSVLPLLALVAVEIWLYYTYWAPRSRRRTAPSS